MRCNTKVIQLFLMSRISYMGRIVLVCQSRFSLAISFELDQMKKQHVLFLKDQGPRLV